MPTSETRVPPLLADAAGCAPAPLHWRALALALDGLLAAAATGLVFSAYVVPEYFPSADAVVGQQMQVLTAHWQAALRGEALAPMEVSAEFMELAGSLMRTALALFFSYFAVSEWAMRGTTLGKRVFTLRTALLGTGEPPAWFDTLVRSLVKSVSLLAPVFLLCNVLPLAFGRQRRAGHDYFARTLVTGDAPPEGSEAAQDGDPSRDD